MFFLNCDRYLSLDSDTFSAPLSGNPDGRSLGFGVSVRGCVGARCMQWAVNVLILSLYQVTRYRVFRGEDVNMSGGRSTLSCQVSGMLYPFRSLGVTGNTVSGCRGTTLIKDESNRLTSHASTYGSRA